MSSANKRYLIINADDVGYCEERNLGIFKAMLSNAISDATVLVTIDRVALNHFKDLIENHFKDDSDALQSFKSRLGLHLNFTEGNPATQSHSTISSLINEQGQFFGKFGFSKEMISGKIITTHIELETESQIRLFIETFGTFPSHLDGHNHAHVVPGVPEIISKVMHRFGIQKTRLPYEPFLDLSKQQSPWMNEASNKDFLLGVCEWAEKARSVFDSHAIRYPSHFMGLALMSENSRLDYIEKILPSLPISTIAFDQFEVIRKQTKTQEKNNVEENFCSKVTISEWMVHPGFKQQSTKYGDDFSRSQFREEELKNLESIELKQLFEKFDVQLVNWNSL